MTEKQRTTMQQDTSATSTLNGKKTNYLPTHNKKAHSICIP